MAGNKASWNFWDKIKGRAIKDEAREDKSLSKEGLACQIIVKFIGSKE